MMIRRNFISYTLVCCLLLFTSVSSVLSVDKTLLVVWAFFSLLSFINRRFSARRSLFRVIIVLLFITLVYGVINSTLDNQTYIGFFVYVLGAYATVKYCGTNFIKVLVNIVYVLAAISLPLYIVQLLAPDFLYSVNNLAGLNVRENSNSLLFNFTRLHPTRNCGFMWEPGAFAGVLILTMFLNVTVLENYKLFTLKNKVFIFALFSTFSTLGYLSLIFPILAVIFNRKLYHYFLWLTMTIPILFSLDFLLPKLFNESSNVSEELYKTQYATEDSRVSVSRSTTFAIDLTSFLERPVLGYGVDFRTTSAKKIYKEYDENVIRSSGVMNILLKFGVAGLLTLISLAYLSLRSRSTKITSLLFCLLLFIVLLSNPFDNSPFMYSLLFLYQPGTVRRPGHSPPIQQAHSPDKQVATSTT